MEFLAEAVGCGVSKELRGPGTVLAIHAEAVNIELSTGFCLSLVSNQLDLAPNRIRLAEFDQVRGRVKPGDMVCIGWHQLWHYSFSIAWPKPLLSNLAPIIPMFDSLEPMQKLLQSGTGACRCYMTGASDSVIDKKVAAEAEKLNNGSNGESLLGLGKGLTPAGDDILTGYLAAGRRLGLDLSRHRDMPYKAFTATGSLSATAIYFAARGRVQQRLEAVISALASSSEELVAPAEALMAVGSSSGSDMLLGVYIALIKYFAKIGSDIA